MREKINCENTNYIICPHCEYEHEDVFEEESCEFECCHCQKKFWLEVETVTTFTSTCGKTNEDCDFVDKPKEKYPDYQECSRCGNHNFKRFNN